MGHISSAEAECMRGHTYHICVIGRRTGSRCAAFEGEQWCTRQHWPGHTSPHPQSVSQSVTHPTRADIGVSKDVVAKEAE